MGGTCTEIRQEKHILYVYLPKSNLSLVLVGQGEADVQETFEELGKGSRVVSTIKRLLSPPEVDLHT